MPIPARKSPDRSHHSLILASAATDDDECSGDVREMARDASTLSHESLRTLKWAMRLLLLYLLKAY
jgi:hypothetical protein